MLREPRTPTRAILRFDGIRTGQWLVTWCTSNLRAVEVEALLQPAVATQPVVAIRSRAMEDLIFRTSERVPQLVIDVLEAKGYREQEEEDGENNWHVHWKAGRFKPSEYAAANRTQRVNHFPKTTGITKKDTLLRNLRRMRAIHGQIFNFFPESCAHIGSNRTPVAALAKPVHPSTRELVQRCE